MTAAQVSETVWPFIDATALTVVVFQVLLHWLNYRQRTHRKRFGVTKYLTERSPVCTHGNDAWLCAECRK